MHLVQTAHNDAVTCLGGNGTELVYLDDTLTRNGVGVLRSRIACDTTRVEGTKSQLRTRLTDGLRGNDTDRLTFLHHLTRCKVAAVALGANAVFRFAGEHRTDFNLLDTGSLDSLASRLANLLAGSHNQIAVQVVNIMYRHTTQDTLREGSHHGIVLLDGARRQTTKRTAVLLVDDHIVRHIDQTTGQVTGVGGLQCGIGQTLTSTVGRDKVLQHGHTLFEVRQNRVLNGLTTFVRTGLLRLGHQTTDTC